MHASLDIGPALFLSPTASSAMYNFNKWTRQPQSSYSPCLGVSNWTNCCANGPFKHG